MRRRAAIATVILLGLGSALVACAGGGTGADTAATGTTASPSVADSSTNTAPPASAAPPASGGGPVPTSPQPHPNASSAAAPSANPLDAEITVRGNATEGVEAGCVVLVTDDGKTYLLVGGDRGIIGGGGRLEARGRVEPGLASYCQQGTPFQVREVRQI